MSKKYWSPGDEITAEDLNHTDVGFKVLEQTTPGMTLRVDPGVVIVQGTAVKYAGGNTPTFTAPASNPRIDLITIDSAGTIDITQGTEAGSPSAPTYPTDKFVIAEIYLRTTSTTLRNVDGGSSTGYIYKDSRPPVVPKPPKFGGTGADGALSVPSGTTTINLGNADVVVKNYTSINIASGATLAFSNPGTNGTIIILKSQGNVDIVGTIDASGMGGAGGGGGAANSGSGSAGSTGLNILDDSNHGGGGGTYGNQAAVGTAGAIHTNLFLYTTSIARFTRRFISIHCGSGGGGGSGGNGSPSTSTGGDGGRGGGAVLLECAGALNFTGTINVSGKNGSAGGNSTGSGSNVGGGGGGGGGSAGSAFILYNTLTANSGTKTATGGTGGAGGNTSAPSSGGGGNQFWGGQGGGGGGSRGGAGGAGGLGAASNTTNNGSNGSNAASTGAGSGGGGGSTCTYNANTTRTGGSGGTAGGNQTDAIQILENTQF